MEMQMSVSNLKLNLIKTAPKKANRSQLKRMEDLDLDCLNGWLNMERRTDGGIGLYAGVSSGDVDTLHLNKEQFEAVIKWLNAYYNLSVGIKENEK